MDRLDPSDSEHLNALVQECADKWEDVGPQILEDLCARHPERAKALRRRLTLLQQSGLLEAAPTTPIERLGDFQLLTQLGAGGMGVVYRAEQLSLRRQVALKVIRPDHAFFADSRQRFLREVNAVARLQHPGIVPVHVAGEDQGVLYYAMELVPGCTLARVLEHLHGRDPATLTGADLAAAIVRCAPRAEDAEVAQRGLAATTVFGASWVECCLRLVQQISNALDHAHGRGVLHRDVKPSNVMLTPSGRVMLLDFGLASTDTDQRVTRAGAQLGSLAYMSPEQVRGDLEAIARTTDVYGAGVLLYELLTLTQPFQRPLPEATRQAILAGNPGPLRAHNRALPTDAELVCLKAMDVDPARRYPRAQDLAQDLANVLELRPIEARPPSVWLRARRAAQRRPARALSLAFAGLLLLGVFPLLYLQQRGARLAVEAEQGRTAGALAETKVALARAEAQEKRARWGLGKAREAVDRFLADIGEFRAVDIPLLEQLRRDTLQQAAALYEQLLQDPDGERDRALAFEHARTLYSLSSVLRDLGRLTEAEPVLQRVVAALSAPDGGGPTRETRRLLAMARSALGATLRQLDRPSEAEVALVQAGEELRQLVAENDGRDGKGGEPDADKEAATERTSLLSNTVSLANLRREQRRVDEALVLYEETIQLGAGPQSNIEVLRMLAEARTGLAIALANQSRGGTAREHYVQAIALRREVVARAPSSARFRRELARALADLGSHIRAWQTAVLVEALPPLDESAALFAELVRDFPQQSSYQVEYSRMRITTAQVRDALNEDGDAERDWCDAAAGLERVRAELPRENSWRNPLVYARHTLARHYQEHGRDADAAAEQAKAQALLHEFLRESPEDQHLRQQQAELILARSDSKLLTADEALALAREAFAMGEVFLRDHRDDGQLYGTAFRCFERLATLLCDRGDVEGSLAVADAYRAGDPYKWLCQLTLARTYLRCRTLLEPAAAAGDQNAQAVRQRCLDDARQAVLRAGEHSPKAVLRIRDEALFEPLMRDEVVQDALQRGRAAG